MLGLIDYLKNERYSYEEDVYEDPNYNIIQNVRDVWEDTRLTEKEKDILIAEDVLSRALYEVWDGRRDYYIIDDNMIDSFDDLSEKEKEALHLFSQDCLLHLDLRKKLKCVKDAYSEEDMEEYNNRVVLMKLYTMICTNEELTKEFASMVKKNDSEKSLNNIERSGSEQLQELFALAVKQEGLRYVYTEKISEERDRAGWELKAAFDPGRESVFDTALFDCVMGAEMSTEYAGAVAGLFAARGCDYPYGSSQYPSCQEISNIWDVYQKQLELTGRITVESYLSDYQTGEIEIYSFARFKPYKNPYTITEIAEASWCFQESGYHDEDDNNYASSEYSECLNAYFDDFKEFLDSNLCKEYLKSFQQSFEQISFWSSQILAKEAREVETEECEKNSWYDPWIADFLNEGLHHLKLPEEERGNDIKKDADAIISSVCQSCQNFCLENGLSNRGIRKLFSPENIEKFSRNVENEMNIIKERFDSIHPKVYVPFTLDELQKAYDSCPENVNFREWVDSKYETGLTQEKEQFSEDESYALEKELLSGASETSPSQSNNNTLKM